MARSSDERWTAGAILVCLYAIFIVWFCGFPMAPTPITEVDAEVRSGYSRRKINACAVASHAHICPVNVWVPPTRGQPWPRSGQLLRV